MKTKRKKATAIMNDRKLDKVLLKAKVPEQTSSYEKAFLRQVIARLPTGSKLSD